MIAEHGSVRLPPRPVTACPHQARISQIAAAGARAAKEFFNSVAIEQARVQGAAPIAPAPRPASDEVPTKLLAAAPSMAPRDRDGLPALLAQICTTARSQLERLIELEGDKLALWIDLGDEAVSHAADVRDAHRRLATFIERGRKTAADRSRTKRRKPK